MNIKQCGAWACISFFSFSAAVEISRQDVGAVTGGQVAQQKAAQIEFITAEELKAKLANSAPVTIIDVRGSSSSLDTSNKIKGAVYVKLRRLKYRLGFPPLKDVPRNREVVTYCACPNDESSVKAAALLRAAGFNNVRVLKGGWVVWKKNKGQVEPMSRRT